MHEAWCRHQNDERAKIDRPGTKSTCHDLWMICHFACVVSSRCCDSFYFASPLGYSSTIPLSTRLFPLASAAICLHLLIRYISPFSPLLCLASLPLASLLDSSSLSLFTSLSLYVLPFFFALQQISRFPTHSRSQTLLEHSFLLFLICNHPLSYLS